MVVTVGGMMPFLGGKHPFTLIAERALFSFTSLGQCARDGGGVRSTGRRGKVGVRGRVKTMGGKMGRGGVCSLDQSMEGLVG